MSKYLKIDEGHYFDLEETISYVRWKVSELIRLKWKKKDIINFDDNGEWKKQAIRFLASMKNKKSNNKF